MGWIWKSFPDKERETAPFWKQSGAVLRERTIDRSQIKGSGNTGERAARGAGDRVSGQRTELRRLEHAYGRISFFAEPGKRVGVETARKSGFQESQRPESSRRLNENRLSQVTMAGGKGYVDSHQKENSAFRWTESAFLPPERVMDQLRRLSCTLSQNVLCDMLPEAGRETEVHRHSPLFQKLENGLRRTMEEAKEISSEYDTQKKGAGEWLTSLDKEGAETERSGLRAEEPGDEDSKTQSGEQEDQEK